MARKYFQVQTTIDDRERADEIVDRVVGERLAACGQITGPVESTYWWKGKLETETEWLCLFKTTAGLVRRLRHFIAEIHPYETPEIVAFEIDAVSSDFGDWIDDETDE